MDKKIDKDTLVFMAVMYVTTLIFMTVWFSGLSAESGVSTAVAFVGGYFTGTHVKNKKEEK